MATNSSILGFPGGSAGKESACNAEDLGSIPGLGRCPGEGTSYPLQYFGLENSMDMDSTWGPKESNMTEQLPRHFTSSIHAWRIPWTEEPGRLQSIGFPGQT